MGTYEVAVVLHPDLEIDPEAPKSRVEESLSGAGATIKSRDEWGKRKLAYPIAGQTFGIYIFYVIQVEGDRVADIKQALQLNEEVIRHMVVTHEANAQPRAGDDQEDAEENSKKDSKENSQENSQENSGDSPAYEQTTENDTSRKS
ncbi:30S ribosomal protein S6 [Candidatus Saccharibacteria bacterium QS_5_54_17]|nr:MAG: 30S ribosomal protein S6 [Candidatus Saccharibacteria bacterium QS_5_54_17]